MDDGAQSSLVNRDEERLSPAQLDALTAAPAHHQLLFENDCVRVLDTCIPAGESVPVHTHCWPSVWYVLSFSQFVRYDEHGNVLLDSRTVDAFQNPAPVIYSAPLPPHSLENVGTADLHIISIELKD